MINRRIGTAVQFHDVLSGFHAGWGIYTTSLEEKIIQQLTEMREEFLYKVFLDMQKAYDALYREICMDILVGCGFGPRMDRILWWY